MPTKDQVRALLEQTRSYFVDHLLPFWMDNSPDLHYGGFLSYFDRNGKPTGHPTASPPIGPRLGEVDRPVDEQKDPGKDGYQDCVGRRIRQGGDGN